MRKLLVFVAVLIAGVSYMSTASGSEAHADTQVIHDFPCGFFSVQPFPGTVTGDFGGYIDESALPDFDLGSPDNPFPTKILEADRKLLIQNETRAFAICTFDGSNADWMPEPPKRAVHFNVQCFDSIKGHAVLTPNGRLISACHFDHPLFPQ